MSIRVGNKRIFKVYVGTKEIGMVWVGTKNIFPGTGSVIPGPDPMPVPGPTDGILYMVGSQNDVLYTVDATTGVATRVGNSNQFGIGESLSLIHI